MASSAISPLQQRMQNHLLATHAMLCVLRVVEQLGDTIEHAPSSARSTSPYAKAWFNAANLTIKVQPHNQATKEALDALVTLSENGYHGFVGPFEVDQVESNGTLVVIHIRQGGDEEPPDDPEAIVAAAELLMP